MSEQENWATRLTTLCGAVVALVGVFVLVGWWLDIVALKSVMPGQVSMKANTALAFVLAGSALALLSPPAPSKHRITAGRWLALLVALIGALTLCEFFFGWQLGIDEILFKDDALAVATSTSGRMAPSTALCFLLLGLAFLRIEWQPRPGFRPAELLAFAALLISLISLLEYAVGEPILYGFSQYTRMAAHTAVVFVLLCAGVLLARPRQGLVGALRAGRISRKEQAAYASVVLLFLALWVSGAWFYRAQEQQARANVETELQAISQLKVDQLVQWRSERLADAAVLMDSEFFADGVASWLARPRPDLAEKILQRFRAMQQYNGYNEIVLVDKQARVRLALSEPAEALHPLERTTLATALREVRPVLSDLHFDSNSLVPHANLVAPLSVMVRGRREVIGAIILNLDARRFLYPLIASWPTPTTSAETLLVRRDGPDALFLNDLRHRPNSALSFRIALTRTDVPAVLAVLGMRGVFRGMDYRGIRVLSVLSPIPDTAWFMVTKIDEVEALATWRLRSGMIVLAGLVLTLALGGACLLIWQKVRRVRELQRAAQELTRAHRAYRVLSQYNQTLVHASNEQELLDRICTLLVEDGGYRCAWVGFAQDDALKRVQPVAQHGFEAGYVQSLHLTWGDDGSGRCPTGSAIRDGQDCVARSNDDGAAYEIWREGAARHGYASSISLPLRFNGAVGGALTIYSADAQAFTSAEVALLTGMANDLAFGIRALRGNAARKLAQEALALERNKLSAAFSNVAIGLTMCDAQGGNISMNPAALKFHGFSSEQDMGRRLQDYASDWELRYVDGRIMPFDEWPLARALRGDCVSNFDTVLHNVKTGFEIVCSYTSAQVRNSAGEVVLVVMTTVDISGRIRTEAALKKMNLDLDQSRQELRQWVALNETALENEKRHIAREVHDELGQVLTALRMSLTLATVRHAAQAPGLLEALDGMKTQVDRAIRGVRNVASSLRPPELDLGLVTAVEWLCDEFRLRSGVVCELQAADEAIECDASRAVVVFRIVQESLTNISKYAQASQVVVNLVRRGNELRVEVRDNGLGFDPATVAHSGSLGLLGMRERAIALGGRVEVHAKPGQGTVIALLIPLDPDGAREAT